MWKSTVIAHPTAPRWGREGREARPWVTASHMTLFVREPRGPFRTHGGRAPCEDFLAHVRSTEPGCSAPLA